MHGLAGLPALVALAISIGFFLDAICSSLCGRQGSVGGGTRFIQGHEEVINRLGENKEDSFLL